MRVTIIKFCFLLCTCLVVTSASVTSPSLNFPAEITLCDVMDYGAVGDGVTDDTLAVQNAFHNCAVSSTAGALMYFPIGNYKLVSTITSTFEFSFFFQECSSNSPQNAVSFVGQVNEAGVRSRILWTVASSMPVPQANFFNVVYCSNFGLSNIDIDVSSPIPAVVMYTEGSNGITISDVHWNMASGSVLPSATGIIASSVSNILIQNAVFDNGLEIFFIECTEVIVLQLTIQSNVASNSSVAITAQGGSSFQFENLVVSNINTGISFWSETPEEAAVKISRSTFNTNEAIVVYNNISLTVADSFFTGNGVTPASTYSWGISIYSTAQPCLIVNNSTFSYFTGAAIQNMEQPFFQPIIASSQKTRAHAMRSGERSSTCLFLTLQDSLFDLNYFDLLINANTWQLSNNVCISKDNSQLVCSEHCIESNNLGCNFIPAEQNQRSSSVILQEQ